MSTDAHTLKKLSRGERVEVNLAGLGCSDLSSSEFGSGMVLTLSAQMRARAWSGYGESMGFLGSRSVENLIFERHT